MEELIETQKQNIPQGELFNEICAENISLKELQTSSLKESRKQVTVSFDKFLIVLLILIIVISVAYAFGVATGRGTSQREEKSHPSILVLNNEAAPGTQTDDSNYRTTEDIQEEVPMTAPSVVQTEDIQAIPREGWTVQIVTYTDQSRAREEVAKLRDEGLHPFIIPSGKYYQVCVNTFANRRAALKMLATFATDPQYFDAYVRKINRS